jgi:hypothetical protein
MIHIIHTPAAVLARRRETLARRCLAAVLLPGLGVLLWAAATPIIEMRGKPHVISPEYPSCRNISNTRHRI